MKPYAVLALLAIPAILPAQSKQEKIADAILHATTARVRATSGATITLSTEKAQRYVLAVVAVMQGADRNREMLRGLMQQKGENPAAWAARLGKQPEVVRALLTQKMSAAEYVGLGVTLHSAWESSHGRRPIVAPDPVAVEWVKRNELAVQSLATVDGRHIPWPDGSIDGKGVRDRRIW